MISNSYFINDPHDQLIEYIVKVFASEKYLYTERKREIKGKKEREKKIQQLHPNL